MHVLYVEKSDDDRIILYKVFCTFLTAPRKGTNTSFPLPSTADTNRSGRFSLAQICAANVSTVVLPAPYMFELMVIEYQYKQ
jgi:hypothetical protein